MHKLLLSTAIGTALLISLVHAEPPQPQAGHSVKIYGNNPDSRDYDEYVCTSTGCGRANANEPAPDEITTWKTRRNEAGDSVTIKKKYWTVPK